MITKPYMIGELLKFDIRRESYTRIQNVGLYYMQQTFMLEYTYHKQQIQLKECHDASAD